MPIAVTIHLYSPALDFADFFSTKGDEPGMLDDDGIVRDADGAIIPAYDSLTDSLTDKRVAHSITIDNESSGEAVRYYTGAGGGTARCALWPDDLLLALAAERRGHRVSNAPRFEGPDSYVNFEGPIVPPSMLWSAERSRQWRAEYVKMA